MAVKPSHAKESTTQMSKNRVNTMFEYIFRRIFNKYRKSLQFETAFVRKDIYWTVQTRYLKRCIVMDKRVGTYFIILG